MFARQGPLRDRRSFDGVNVVVNRSHVVGIALEHRFERGDDFFGPGFRSSVLMPEAPGMQVHAGFGEQRGGVQVIGKVLRHLTHGVVISLGCLSAVRFRICRKTQRHGLDVGLLRRRSVAREIDSLLNGVVRFDKTFVAGRIVVVRPYGFGDAPLRHRQLGVKLGGAMK